MFDADEFFLKCLCTAGRVADLVPALRIWDIDVLVAGDELPQHRANAMDWPGDRECAEHGNEAEQRGDEQAHAEIEPVHKPGFRVRLLLPLLRCYDQRGRSPFDQGIQPVAQPAGAFHCVSGIAVILCGLGELAADGRISLDQFGEPMEPFFVGRLVGQIERGLDMLRHRGLASLKSV